MGRDGETGAVSVVVGAGGMCLGDGVPVAYDGAVVPLGEHGLVAPAGPAHLPGHHQVRGVARDGGERAYDVCGHGLPRAGTGGLAGAYAAVGPRNIAPSRNRGQAAGHRGVVAIRDASASRVRGGCAVARASRSFTAVGPRRAVGGYSARARTARAHARRWWTRRPLPAVEANRKGGTRRPPGADSAMAGQLPS